MRTAPKIPDHTLRGPIGRGAYGEVWLASNVMGAPRAVKIVWRERFESDRPYEREFAGIQRYEPVSRSADGLVHVLHVGRNDAESYFYYVMELADSATAAAGQFVVSNTSPKPDKTAVTEYAPRTLRSDMKRLGRLPVADCLNLALDLVGGLARLHDCGLVHRDVKPANIIFVNGRAKLTDIGLVSTESEGRTFVGTEGYVPPEGPGSPSADLYALGMVLYEAGTGFPPENFPKVPPEWFAEEADPIQLEFHEVVLKACEGSRERRYQSAKEMQADVALLQSGQSVRRLRSLEKRAAHWRNAGWAAAITVALALTAAILAYWRAQLAAEREAREIQLREQAQTSLARARIAERESRQQLYTSLLEQSRANVRSGELGQRVRTLEAARRGSSISNSVALRREVIAALALPDLRFEREWVNSADVTAKQFDPTFERIAICRGTAAVELRRASDDFLLATLPAAADLPCYNVTWSADAEFLAVKRDRDLGGYRSDLEIFRVVDATRVLRVRDVHWNGFSFRPGGSEILTIGAGGSIAAWSLPMGIESRRYTLEAEPEELSCSPEGARIATAHFQGGGWVLSVRNAENGTQLASHLFPSRISSVCWHPSGRWLAVSDVSGAVQLMEAETGEAQVLGQHQVEAVSTTFSPDGAYLISGGWERELICWDVFRKRRAFTIGLDSYILQFRADGRQCAIVTPSRVQLYAFEQPSAHREFPEDLGPRLRYAAFSGDGRWLAASAGKRLGVWDLSRPAPGALAEEGHEVQCSFTSDAAQIIGSRNQNNEADPFRWRINPATEFGAPPLLTRLPLPKPEGFTALSLHSNWVAITAKSRSQLIPTEKLESLPEHWKPTSPGLPGISPDGRWLAIYEPFGSSLRVYQLPELEPVVNLQHPASIATFQFSPKSDELAICSLGRVEFWNTERWERSRVLTNYSRVLYMPDQRTFWLTTDLRTAGLYNARTLEPLLMLPIDMLPLALSADGRQLAVSVETRRLQVWDLTELRAVLGGLGLDWEPAPLRDP